MVNGVYSLGQALLDYQQAESSVRRVLSEHYSVPSNVHIFNCSAFLPYQVDYEMTCMLGILEWHLHLISLGHKFGGCQSLPLVACTMFHITGPMGVSAQAERKIGISLQSKQTQ